MKTFIHILFTLSLTTGIISCRAKHDQTLTSEELHTYTCPMHPQIMSDKPGTCPICGMDLVAVTHGGNQDEELMLNETQIKLANVTTQEIQSGSMSNGIVLSGRLVPNQEQTQAIASRVQGRIERLYIKEVGLKVKKGQPLYELYSEQMLTLQKEYLLAFQQVLAFPKNQRYKAFFEAAEKKLLLIGMTQNQIKEIAKTGVTSSRVTFLAPYSGVVAELLAVEGQYLSEGGLLYRLENLNKIWVEAELYPNEAKLVSEGNQVTVIINGYENKPVKAKITFLSPEYKKGSQIITLRAEIDNSQTSYQPGLEAEVILHHSTQNTLTLPSDAVIRDQKGTHVWVEVREGVFKPRMVKTGMENFNKVEILEGLEENEKVVVSGPYLLYSEFILKKGGDLMSGHQHIPTLTRHSEETSDSSKKHENINDSSLRPLKLKELTKEYFKIKDALSNSNASQASNAAASMLNAINQTQGKDHVRGQQDLEAMNENLMEISNSENLEKQRTAFADLSIVMHKVLKEFKVPDSVVYYQFCPMALDNKGAYWLSNKKEISNPFFGEKMPTCGEVKEVLKGVE